MSITATNYISSTDLEGWMELKTEDLYGNLRTSMDTSNDRAEAEKALNTIKAELTAAGKSGDDPTAIRDEIQAAMDKFKDEFPDVATALKPALDKLNTAIADAGTPTTTVLPAPSGGHAAMLAPVTTVTYGPPAKVDSADAEAWGKQIGDCVDGLGKDDQLAMINIQEYNSEINQTKQIASALLDSMNKAAEATISHIS